MKVNKHDVISLVLIGSLATISTAIILPQVTKSMNVITANKHKANLKAKKVVAKSNIVDSRDLVASALALGAIWAVTRR